jgi:coenzyme F420-0:L-glutamate ligase/coenzyme F420-1:gamma-L-glutamate ligase
VYNDSDVNGDGASSLSIDLIGLRLPEVRPGDDIVGLILSSASEQGLSLLDNDVVVITSKVISKAKGLLFNIHEIKPSRKALSIARKAGLDPRFVELLLRESDRIVLAIPFEKIVREVLGPGFLSRDPSRVAEAIRSFPTVFITVRNGFLWSDSGIDTSNHPPNIYSVPPRRLDEVAMRISEEIRRRTGIKAAVVICDTELFPWGAMDIARGSYGIEPIKREFGELDMYGKPKFGGIDNTAFSVCSAASLLMGQRAESVPVVIVRGLRYSWSEIGVGKALAEGLPEERFMIAVRESIKHSARVLGARWLLRSLSSVLLLRKKG